MTMSSIYSMKKRIQADLDAGRPVVRQCSCCGEMFQIFELELSMSVFVCFECWYEVVGEGQAEEALSQLRIRPQGPNVSQSYPSQTERT
jgi:hypothetical protein